jgi:chorismate synthase
MGNLRYLTSGESHGKALTGIIEGIPSGFSLSSEDIDRELKRRQGGHGRGGRMKIESDRAEILSGVRLGKTIGSPIGILIENKDWQNWKEVMSAEVRTQKSEIRSQKSEGKDHRLEAVTRPRPGHADLAGALKYNEIDIRNILERSSARETAMRVALGAVAKRMLSEFNIKIGSYVIQIGSQKSEVRSQKLTEEKLLEYFKKAEKSPVRCPDADISKKMVRLIDRAIGEGDSLGGVFEVFITGVPVGLGSHVQWDRRLEGRLSQAVMGIQAIKGVEAGAGFGMAGEFGSAVMDEIFFRSQKAEGRTRKSGNNSVSGGFYRKTNYAGGIEGGISNGMPIITLR